LQLAPSVSGGRGAVMATSAPWPPLGASSLIAAVLPGDARPTVRASRRNASPA
jgi:hypothetical protein